MTTVRPELVEGSPSVLLIVESTTAHTTQLKSESFAVC
ncbi:hypothetical protein MNBD_GAMMA25-2482 [hydrothermal vent metagenome]|uniref:Uncharacterized protein n=1 Tax=hydrothermal vent metagenome TaxID=652676 RepID=A0A3B1BFH1_9ZZZZ